MKTTKKFKLTKALPWLAGAVAAIPAIGFSPINQNMTTDQLFDGILSVIFQIFKYGGALIAIAGIILIVMGFKDDNPEQKTRGILLACIGVVLFGLEGVLKLAGIIT